MPNKTVYLKLIIVVVLISAGLLTKTYSGFGREFVNNYLGGIIYVVFFIILGSLILPSANILKLSLIVLFITCLLEFSQLLKGEILNELRAHFIFRSLIGSVFNVFDFMFYIAGASVGYCFLRFLKSRNDHIK
jgi:hypothetical protein